MKHAPIIGLLASLAAHSVLGETNVVIEAFAGNGSLSWSNHPGAVEYRVEWTSAVTDPWTNSWNALNGIQATGAHYTVKVPMFYRLVAVMPDYTRLLLHCDGPDGSTAPTDSTGRHSATVIGNAQLSTGQNRFGGASALFDGAGDYLEFPDSPDFDPGSEPFTIDFWIHPWIGGSGNQYLIGKSNPDAGQGYDLRLEEGRIQVTGINGWAVNIVTDPVVTSGAWHHIALSCSRTDAILFVDGTNRGSSARSPTSDTTVPLRVGFTTSYGGAAYHGYMDEIRYSLGTARWTNNFVIPSSPYEDD
jgi:hypothetical protein